MELFWHASTLCISDSLSKIEGLLDAPKVSDPSQKIFPKKLTLESQVFVSYDNDNMFLSV